MYLTEAMLSKEDPMNLMGYTKDQWDWCKANEGQMWNYIKTYKHLYTYDRLVISKYVNPGPKTAFFPDGLPAKTGIWLGWQIVRSYMKNNPGRVAASSSTITTASRFWSSPNTIQNKERNCRFSRISNNSPAVTTATENEKETTNEDRRLTEQQRQREQPEFIPVISDGDDHYVYKEGDGDNIPILALRNMVLFPGVIMPAALGRKKSLAAVKNAYKRR